MDARKRYPSDLTDLQWYNIEHLFQCAARGKGGRPRTYPLREVVNAPVLLGPQRLRLADAAARLPAVGPG